MLNTHTHTRTLHTFAGGTFPAAVICPVKNRPKLLAANTTALYLKGQSNMRNKFFSVFLTLVNSRVSYFGF